MNLLTMFLTLAGLCSCERDLIEYKAENICVRIEAGKEWLHDFPVFLGISKKNPPQIAVWVEDSQGNYMSTVYVSHKIATQSWQMAGGNRRKEALPHWCHSRGVRYADGLYLPTKDEPLTDGISGATPRGGFDVKLVPAELLRKFVVKIEVNHSTDWNAAYPKSAEEGESNYSGGKEGSGQPAVVYAAVIDLTRGQKEFEAELLGHSSPDGSSGELCSDISELTTALHIVERITVQIR